METWAALAIALALAFLAVWAAGRQSKAADVRARDAEARAEAIKDKKELDDEVADLGDDDLDGRFDRWMR